MKKLINKLGITYVAGEKSGMRELPNAVVIMLTDGATEMTLPDGNKIEDMSKFGDASWTPAGKHIPKNVGNNNMEAILVELKTKPE